MAGKKLIGPLIPAAMKPDALLADVIGDAPRTIHEVCSDVWRYLDEKGKARGNRLLSEPALAPLFSGEPELPASDLGARIAEHVQDMGEPINCDPRTYLLTWNPKKFHWEDIEETVALLHEDGSVDLEWSCGRSKRIAAGDRIFLMRQGAEPKGIIASAVAVSGAIEGEHWDAEKAAQGRTETSVQLDCEVLLNPDVEAPLSRSTLLGRVPDVNWDTQVSGISIAAGPAETLEDLWAEHLESLGYQLPDESDPASAEAAQ